MTAPTDGIESQRKETTMTTAIITETDIAQVTMSGRDTEYLDPPTPGGRSTVWSAPVPLTIQRDGDNRPTDANLSAALVAAAGLLDSQATAVRIALDVTDGGPLVRTVEYELRRA